MNRAGIFGWSLPPGCGTLPGEEQNYPPFCEDCPAYFELKTDPKKDAVGYCPAGPWEKNGPDFDRCPVVGFVQICAGCKKRVGLFKRDIPQDHVVNGIEETMFCCSKGCADTLKAKVDAEIKEMMNQERNP